jgi:hypothetical protein
MVRVITVPGPDRPQLERTGPRDAHAEFGCALDERVFPGTDPERFVVIAGGPVKVLQGARDQFNGDLIIGCDRERSICVNADEQDQRGMESAGDLRRDSRSLIRCGGGKTLSRMREPRPCADDRRCGVTTSAHRERVHEDEWGGGGERCHDRCAVEPFRGD